MADLILASSSVYRLTLLKRLGIPFQTAIPGVDETAHDDETPRQLGNRLAQDKARAVFAVNPQAVVIGSDQVCAFGDQICGKPLTKERAIEQLSSFSNQCVSFYTGLCVMGPGGIYQHTDVTRVNFRLLSLAAIQRYIDVEKPLDCAGAFKVEGLGISLFESIENTDPTALMGLPLIKLAAFLRQSGFQIP